MDRMNTKAYYPRGTTKQTFLIGLLLLIIISFTIMEIHFSMLRQKINTHKKVRVSKRKNNHSDTPLNVPPSPWNDMPSFHLYLRMSSFERFVIEYKRWFVKSYKHFFPPERQEGTLVIVLDGENPKDHKVGKLLQSLWPHPRICYQDPAEDTSIYENRLRYRSYWDQFYPERCTTAEYVGFVDSDTMWSSLVTPGSFFENGKAVVNARIGSENHPCWPLATHFLLGEKQVPQCMTYFPVMIKVQHIIELRQFVARRFGTSFDEAFKRSLKFGPECICQYSIFCNFIWYHKRDEYSFHLQMSPNDKWDGKYKYVPEMASLDFLKREIADHMTVPKPRVTIHMRHLRTKLNKAYYDKDPNIPPISTELHAILSESFCYNGGFERCPLGCKQFNESKLNYYFFIFEWWEWHWDPRCHGEQLKYLQEVKDMLDYYKKSRNWLLGVSNNEELCWLIT